AIGGVARDGTFFDQQISHAINRPAAGGLVLRQDRPDQLQVLFTQDGPAHGGRLPVQQLQALDGDVETGYGPVVDVENPAAEIAVEGDLAGAGALQGQAVRDRDFAAVEVDGPFQARLEDDGVGAGVHVRGDDARAQAAGGAVVLEVGDGEDGGEKAAVFKDLYRRTKPARTLGGHGL